MKDLGNSEQEQKLEEASQMIESYTVKKHVPTFEVYATVFSILTAIMLFWFPTMLETTQASTGGLYWLLLSIMPQYMWAFIFFGAGVLKAVGLLVKSDSMRVLGLVMSAILYLVFTICYAINFPAIGMVTFSCMTLFTLISIVLVKHTSLG
jgi:hypothetical protein